MIPYRYSTNIRTAPCKAAANGLINGLWSHASKENSTDPVAVPVPLGAAPAAA